MSNERDGNIRTGKSAPDQRNVCHTVGEVRDYLQSFTDECPLHPAVAFQYGHDAAGGFLIPESRPDEVKP
jgi:hypothetical protein